MVGDKTVSELVNDRDGRLARLWAPFEPGQISKLPKPYSKDAPKGDCRECGTRHGLPALHLDYVGHAAVTARLLEVDPAWTWEPMSLDADGFPRLDRDGGLWIRLTIWGVTRLGYGSADGKTGWNATKERIGDAIRNAAMRFGVALELWHKGDHLYSHADDDPAGKGDPAPADPAAVEVPAGFAVWWDAFAAKSADGLDALGAFWKLAPRQYREYAMAARAGDVAALKEKAGAA